MSAITEFEASYIPEIPYGTIGKDTAILYNERDMVILLFLNFFMLLLAVIFWIAYLIWFLVK